MGHTVTWVIAAGITSSTLFILAPGSVTGVAVIAFLVQALLLSLIEGHMNRAAPSATRRREIRLFAQSITGAVRAGFERRLRRRGPQPLTAQN